MFRGHAPCEFNPGTCDNQCDSQSASATVSATVSTTVSTKVNQSVRAIFSATIQSNSRRNSRYHRQRNSQRNSQYYSQRSRTTASVQYRSHCTDCIFSVPVYFFCARLDLFRAAYPLRVESIPLAAKHIAVDGTHLVRVRGAVHIGVPVAIRLGSIS